MHQFDSREFVESLIHINPRWGVVTVRTRDSLGLDMSSLDIAASPPTSYCTCEVQHSPWLGEFVSKERDH